MLLLLSTSVITNVILYLVRHGEAQLNALGILHSRNYNDNPLTDKGRLEPRPPQCFYVS